jgi:glycosyltransferase involved in cell wall biosynthesis
VNWLIVTGDFQRTGGQDRANCELASFLGTRPGNTVHLVGHDFSPDLEGNRAVVLHRVPRLARSNLLGERALAYEASRVLGEMGARRPIVISNGGNFLSGDVTWVHCVHAFWPTAPFHPPLRARLTAEVAKRYARKRELVAFLRARAIIANSDKTRAHLLSLGIDASKVARVYFGTTVSELPARPKKKKLTFVGALGWDRNKGLDRLLGALRLLVHRPGFDHSLGIIGAGEDRPWRRMVDQLGLGRWVQFLGRVEDVRPSLQESELLVSPARYEAYGLAVQDALIQGVPALVTRTAGIAERYPRALAHLLVDNTDSPEVWANAINSTLSNLERTVGVVRQFASELSRRTWSTMSEEIEFEIKARLKVDSRTAQK